MTVTAFLAYCAAITLAAATPGPAMFAVITNGISRGFVRAFMAGVGVAAGDAVLVTLTLAGLVALAQTFEWIFLLLKYAGAALPGLPRHQDVGSRCCRAIGWIPSNAGPAVAVLLSRRIHRAWQSESDAVARFHHAADPEP